MTELFSGSLSVFFGCTPAIHLALPVFFFVIVSVSVIIIAGSENLARPNFLEIFTGLVIILLGLAVPPIFGLFGLIFLLYYFARMVMALTNLAFRVSPGFAVFVLATGLLLPVIISWRFEDIVSYRSILALSFVLKMSTALAGIMLLRSIIRKTGIGAGARTDSIKAYTAILAVLAFLMLAFRFNLLFNNDLNLYLNILKAKADTFILVFLLLLSGAGFFYWEEKKAAENAGRLNPDEIEISR